jgi:very-short-patch-repair endonuclease/predicted regulator of amino acid metabolism with ACT domain
VRKDVLHALNGVDRLFGDQPILETIEKVFGAQALSGEHLSGMFPGRHAGPITQHYIRNPEDWSHQQMLEHCGALECPQTTFFRLIETVLDPLIRRDQEQAELAEAVSQCLQRDGFAAKATSWQSGYPVFTIVRATPGVVGAMKNLIFASIGAKPDIVIRDAVSNDVEIVRNADKVLVFEKALPSGLLSWADLQAWWAEKMDIRDDSEAKKTLYKRLLQSVKQSGSPGELAMFRAYFEHFGRLDPASLPALLPQVYLHYDPYTKRERGQEQVLARQRMDFLLLLAGGVRIVLEIDGQHHYGDSEADSKFRTNSSKYAAMAAEDRRLRLAGYEVYRFGAGELQLQLGNQEELTAEALDMIVKFFKALFWRHGIATAE